ncbi:MAG TPA: ribosome silencing factor [Opitutaceae bacterium]|nr:ribosome silencing factor [Opitutaceae bacterium]
MTKTKKSAALDLVKACCRVLDDKKAEALTVLDVSAQSSITDYLVVATATSEPHLRALRVELEKALDSSRTRIVGIEMAQESGWVVVDAFDVMIHLFLGPMREHYNLERLWQDATDVSVAKLLAPAAPATRKPPTARRKQSSPSSRSHRKG